MNSDERRRPLRPPRSPPRPRLVPSTNTSRSSSSTGSVKQHQHTCRRTNSHAHTHTHKLACAYTHAHTHTHTRTHTHTQTHWYVIYLCGIYTVTLPKNTGYTPYIYIYIYITYRSVTVMKWPRKPRHSVPVQHHHLRLPHLQPHHTTASILTHPTHVLISTATLCLCSTTKYIYHTFKHTIPQYLSLQTSHTF